MSDLHKSLMCNQTWYIYIWSSDFVQIVYFHFLSYLFVYIQTYLSLFFFFLYDNHCTLEYKQTWSDDIIFIYTIQLQYLSSDCSLKWDDYSSGCFWGVSGASCQAVKVQHPAPDFRGMAVVDGQFKEIQLSDFQGKYLVLFFYPLDLWVCCGLVRWLVGWICPFFLSFFFVLFLELLKVLFISY